MSQSSPLLALDVGQTGIRSLQICDGARIERQFPGIRTDLELFPQLVPVVTEALTGLSEPAIVSIGLTALTKAQSKPAELLGKLLPKVSQIYLSHDSITGFLGSMGLRNGTVTAVGTGVVTLAVGPKEMARVDGWGNLIGDIGSAYWIGRAGLEAGLKAYDGRIPESALTKLLWDNFSHPEEAYIELQTDSNRVSVIAGFAKAVIELAKTDSAAKDIVETAGRELALSAATAARRAGLLETSNPLFSWTGNVMRAENLKQAFISNLKTFVPNAVISEPQSNPIDGVALLPSLPVDSPLRKAIHIAGHQTS